MKTAIPTKSVREVFTWVCTVVVVLALALWDQGAPLGAASGNSAEFRPSGQCGGEELAQDSGLPEFTQEAWLSSDPADRDDSVLSSLSGVVPTAAVAIPERRLQARQVLVPGADWICGHVGRVAFNHPLARAPPFFTL